MPEISRFLGIIIKMFFDAHLPPDFHAEYGEDKARVSINTLSVIGGALPPRVLGLVLEWASIHQAELAELWLRAERHVAPPNMICGTLESCRVFYPPRILVNRFCASFTCAS